jgi:hypothetical protein
MKVFRIVTFFLAVILAVVLIWLSVPGTTTRTTSQKKTARPVADTVKFDPRTGLVEDSNLNLVIANCTACHSAKLIQQHRFSREGWTGKIRWMQKNHNLWDLGSSEKSVLDYLEKYYSPKSEVNRVRARRAPLKNIEWYKL